MRYLDRDANHQDDLAVSEAEVIHHVIAITTSNGKQDARCVCGWEDLGHPYDYTVYDAADAHRREAMTPEGGYDMTR